MMLVIREYPTSYPSVSGKDEPGDTPVELAESKNPERKKPAEPKDPSGVSVLAEGDIMDEGIVLVEAGENNA